MTTGWNGQTREQIDLAILASLTRQWATPKQLEPITGIPWRVLMRAMPRLLLQSRLEGRLDHVVALKHRKRPQRRYRALPEVSTTVYELMIPKFDASSLNVVSIREHRCFEDPPKKTRVKIALGYRG